MISNDGQKLFQSAHFEKESVHKILDLDDDAKGDDHDRLRPVEEYHGLALHHGVKRLHNLQFDEGFGVSGRLLMYCETKKSEFIVHQMFNHNQLGPLRDALQAAEYRLMPGMKQKPFNLVVAVYEMLFGDDLVETLLHSELFNPVLVRMAKEEMANGVIGVNAKKMNGDSNDDGVNMDIEDPQQEGV